MLTAEYNQTGLVQMGEGDVRGHSDSRPTRHGGKIWLPYQDSNDQSPNTCIERDREEVNARRHDQSTVEQPPPAGIHLATDSSPTNG